MTSRRLRPASNNALLQDLGLYRRLTPLCAIRLDDRPCPFMQILRARLIEVTGNAADDRRVIRPLPIFPP
jgi:hypothetical protein